MILFVLEVLAILDCGFYLNDQILFICMYTIIIPQHYILLVKCDNYGT